MRDLQQYSQTGPSTTNISPYLGQVGESWAVDERLTIRLIFSILTILRPIPTNQWRVSAAIGCPSAWKVVAPKWPQLGGKRDVAAQFLSGPGGPGVGHAGGLWQHLSQLLALRRHLVRLAVRTKNLERVVQPSARLLRSVRLLRRLRGLAKSLGSPRMPADGSSVRLRWPIRRRWVRRLSRPVGAGRRPQQFAAVRADAADAGRGIAAG
jgi:hypothetical protein